MLRRIWKTYSLWILFALFFSSFWIYHSIVYSNNFDSRLENFKRDFALQEKKLNDFLRFKIQDVIRNGQSFAEKENPKSDEFQFYVFQKDTLAYWNSNKMPILKHANIHFPTSGIIHSQNGWYYSKSIREGQQTFSGAFLIKNDFPYQNDDLVNSFSSYFDIDFSCYISLDEQNGMPVFSKDKKFLFSVVTSSNQTVSSGQSVVLALLLLFSLSCFLFAIAQFLLKRKFRFSWLFPLIIIGLRLVSIELQWTQFLHDSEIIQPSLYGTNWIFPNFLAYLINSVVVLVVVYFLTELISRQHFLTYGKIITYFLFILIYPFWYFILYLFQGLTENSSIPLEIEALFSLNSYSILAIVSIGVIGYAFFLFVRSIARFSTKQDVPFSHLPVMCFVCGIIFFIWEINAGFQLFFAGFFPLIFIALVLYLEFREVKQKHLFIGISLLATYAFVCAMNISEFNQRKEISERELYANNLATEQDISTEVEFAGMSQKIRSDKYVQKFLQSTKKYNQLDFEESMERRHFNGFWDRYEINYYLFDTSFQSKLTIQGDENEVYQNLQELIEHHGEKSQIDSSIFYIKDYAEQYSYIIRQRIDGFEGNYGTLFCTLKSKKIPEEIGFPRLLISSKEVGFEHLVNYSVAKYHNNRLISKYGRFNYPNSVEAMKNANPGNFNNFDFNGHNHFMLYKSGNDVVVLSGKKITWIDNLTSFSYLFSFFGLLLLPIFIRFYSNSFFRQTLSLAAKIQLVLIGLVFISLLGFGWANGVFVRNQYNQYTDDVIREKLISIETELKASLGKQQSVGSATSTSPLSYQLVNLSKIFVTDINFYDPQGFLISTSRPKVFNIGLLSEQMNPIAKQELAFFDKSEFIHQEEIGRLNYASAYLPMHNNHGKLLGFINLQHFGQQEEFEHQIQRFLVSIINVFMLLLAISTVIAIFVSNWVTSPLRLLQESFSKVSFGKFNEQIAYSKDDEIGALVNDYNQKLEELEFAAQQLAQSERESAWRDMAKQVAHEIKNPLTPMKLSVQHLVRSFDPTDPNSIEKLQKVSNSLIEQIDALTHIANEFSNFAKMPRPREEHADLLQIIESSIALFDQSTDVKIELSGIKNCILKLDKEQFLRVFNNLIKNSIQAMPEGQSGLIEIKVTKNQKSVNIEIKDNGLGIQEEKRSQIFTPYFTTKSTGTGIGLSMVKQIILNHGGTISFESEVNIGTTFLIELPIQLEN